MTDNTTIKTNYPALYTLVTVFFFWGFFAAGNSIFIPFCKDFFALDQFQSQLIDFAFYTAYYFGALILFLISAYKKRDLISKWGFKKSIGYGLLFSVLGAAAMIWAVQLSVYSALLVGLFIVALGFSLQQIAANPLAISLGDPKTGTSRVSLGGAVGSLGTTIGPLLMALALFGSTKSITDDQIHHLSLDAMTVLYIGVGGLFLLASALFYFSKSIPDGSSTEVINPAKKAIVMLLVMTLGLSLVFIGVFSTYSGGALEVVTQSEQALEVLMQQSQQLASIEVQQSIVELQQLIVEQTTNIENKRIILLLVGLGVVVGSICFALYRSKQSPKGWGAMSYPQLLLGMLAIFFYVGVEVGVGSNLGELLKLEEFGALQSSEIAPYISMYWGSLMIGRWAGAVSIFKISALKRTLALIIVPLLAYGVVLTANVLAGNDISMLYYYFICVLVQIGFSFYAGNKSARTMIVFSAFGIIAVTIGLFSQGMVAIYAFLSAGLACSVLWPAIFNIAIMGLGKYTAQGSSFLIMMILGGGIIPPIQGKVADIFGVHQSYVVSLLCLAYLLFFGLIARRVLKQQQIEIDKLD